MMEQKMPTLTLTPELEEPKLEVKQETELAEKAPEAGPDMSMLSLEEQQAVKDFAKQIKVSKSSINMYERGEREPGLETLERIADYFNVDMDYLLGKSEIASLITEQPYTVLKAHIEHL